MIGTYLYNLSLHFKTINCTYAYADLAIRQESLTVEKIINKESQLSLKRLRRHDILNISSPHISISDSVSTETSQLERISRHLAPRASKPLTIDNIFQPTPDEHGLYFQPSESSSKTQMPIPKSISSFELVIPEAAHTNELFQIDSRVDQSKPRIHENDTPKSSHEVLEIAQLYERYSRQARQSSEEEDVIAMETFIGKFYWDDVYIILHYNHKHNQR